MSFRRWQIFCINNSFAKTINNQIFHQSNKQNNYRLNISTCINRTVKRSKDVNIQIHNLKIQKRDFRTSRPNLALPPIVWMVIRSVLNIIAVLTGRGLRIWWSRLPATEKHRIIHKIREKRVNIWLGSSALGVLISLYYVTHLVEDPITKRKKFMLFTEKQIVQIADMQCKYILKSLEKIIVQSGNHYENVLKTSQRILQSNEHFLGVHKKWEVFIINDERKRNAFVLPSGHIFIFTGMLKIISNDDQLAVVLAHEIAHALLNHSAEVISKTHFLELLMLIPIFVIWTLLPDIIALSSHFIFEILSVVLFRLPMNRRMEVEADVVGLVMAARACYDPRQAIVFWKNVEDLGEPEPIEWLSTHPRYKTRYEILRKWMPEALGIRRRHCSKSDLDPRS